jgi:hypothetical protein
LLLRPPRAYSGAPACSVASSPQCVSHRSHRRLTSPSSGRAKGCALVPPLKSNVRRHLESENTVPQDQASGAVANKYGRETARIIAAAIGAKMLGRASNEAELKGSRVVIKCARAKTTSVGVTYQMQKELHSVIAAFELEDGTYKVISLPITAFAKAQRPTRSQGAAAGKVGLVSRAVFESTGLNIANVRV